MDSALVYGLKLLVLEGTGGKTLATDHRVLRGHVVAMFSHYVAQLTATCSSLIGQLFCCMILASTPVQSGCNDPSKYTLGKYWKKFRTPFCLITWKVNLSLMYRE